MSEIPRISSRLFIQCLMSTYQSHWEFCHFNRSRNKFCFIIFFFFTVWRQVFYWQKTGYEFISRAVLPVTLLLYLGGKKTKQSRTWDVSLSLTLCWTYVVNGIYFLHFMWQVVPHSKLFFTCINNIFNKDKHMGISKIQQNLHKIKKKNTVLQQQNVPKEWIFLSFLFLWLFNLFL